MPYETFVLVALSAQDMIVGVIRTYVSKERADSDLELLKTTTPHQKFDLLTVPHIEQ